MTAPPSSSSLPRKRKLSNEGGASENSEVAKPKVRSEASVPTSSMTFSKHQTQIDDSRLPSKKRKGSHDSKERKRSSSIDISKRKESYDSGGNGSKRRKGSQDSSVQFAAGPKPIRKGSHEYAESLLSRPRKPSNDLSVQFQDDLATRKLSNDLSASMPSLPSVSVGRKESMDSSSLKLEDLLVLPPPEERHPDAASLPDLLPTPVNAMEHLDTLERASATGHAAIPTKKEGDVDSQSNGSFTSSGNRLLVEALVGGSSNLAAQLDALKPRGRDRLESWGGMSDLSNPLGSSMLMHVRPDDDESKPAAVREGFVASVMGEGRPRLNSLSGASDLHPRDRSNTLGSLGDISFSGLTATENSDASNVNAMEVMLAARVAASFGDQLEDLALDVETAAETADPDLLRAMRREMGVESDIESTASPIIGATSDSGHKGRPRSWSTASDQISVDLDAVKAAVSAAAGLNMAKIAPMKPPSRVTSKERSRNRRQLPMRSRTNSEFSGSSEDISQRSLYENDRERLVERARRAGNTSSVPFKKRGKRSFVEPEETQPPSAPRTPKHSNRKARDPGTDLPPVPFVAESSSARSSGRTKTQNQSDVKWEGMFDSLLNFIQEKRREATDGLSDSEAAAWQWDGNVPTTYKTPDGKNLGRWVNNQRSAHSKGKLRDSRAERLRDTGLKWSVLTSNSWNGMLAELRKYIDDQTASGKPWDGNVPTNHQIKTRPVLHHPGGKFPGEERNLGRWVNRQRSLYHAGKLREDRQDDLNAIGLKWSMLATNSWDVMFETLCSYVEERKTELGGWDGNVPATFRTHDVPPRALGRWINRQRSAYAKGNLKTEHIEKLNGLGLKWSVHDRDTYTVAARPDVAFSNPALSSSSAPSNKSPLNLPDSAANPDAPTGNRYIAMPVETAAAATPVDDTSIPAPALICMGSSASTSASTPTGRARTNSGPTTRPAKTLSVNDESHVGPAVAASEG